MRDQETIVRRRKGGTRQGEEIEIIGKEKEKDKDFLFSKTHHIQGIKRSRDTSITNK